MTASSLPCRVTPLAVGLAALLSLSGFAGAAHAQSGSMICVANDTGRNRILYSNAFTADRSVEDRMYYAFVAALQSDGYIAADASVSGACHWEANAAQAASASEAYRRRFPGASSMGVSFSAPAVLPNLPSAAPHPAAAPAPAPAASAPAASSPFMSKELAAAVAPKSAKSSLWYMCKAMDADYTTIYYSSTINADASAASVLTAGFVDWVNARYGVKLETLRATCVGKKDEVASIDYLEKYLSTLKVKTRIDTKWMAPVG